MPSKTVAFFLCMLLAPLGELWALVELTGSYSLQKQRLGSQRQNSITSETYHGSIAIYLFSATAIELNYSESEDVAEQNDNIPITDSTYSVTKNTHKARTTIYGIGIKQALAPRKSFLRPTISFGYAKMFVVEGTDYTFYNSADGTSVLYRADRNRNRDESVFIEFSLQIRLSKRFALNGSVKTVYPAFKGGLAKDNMKYLGGFTWYL